MRRIFTSVAPTVVTGIAGIITLVSFFNFLLPGLSSLRPPLIDIAVIVAGVALVMGFVHLLYTHVRRLRRRQSAFYSLALISTALITFVVLILDRAPSSDRTLTRFIFNDLILPLQSALGALLAVFLALAAVRMVQQRRGVGAGWFLLAAFVVLITQIPLSGGLTDALTVVRSFFDAATTGGLRGLLLGVALGTLATAFRVLFFIDRPQSE
jgi:hypothetical protein